MRNISRVIKAVFALISIVVSSSAFAAGSPPFTLNADPNYSFPGSTPPDTAAMYTAIATRLGKPITIVNLTSMVGVNTTLAPMLGNTGDPTQPPYVYGPSANGVVKNLNLNTAVISGIVNAQLAFAGTETVCGITYNTWVLRTFTQTQFNDIRVKVVSCNGTAAGWSFYEISASRFIGGTLGNLSSRANVQTGNNVVIAGFIINGSGTKQVLIRGIGPSVAGLTLADPILELRTNAGTLLLANNDWQDDFNQAMQIQATGLQPGNAVESAIIMTLSPGNYSAVFAGNNGGTGLGVVEIYALSGSAQLGNISTRANVGTGTNVLIAGMIVQAAPAVGPNVAVRALGPSLTQYGISGVMQNPTVELVNSSGATIGYNENWADSQPSEIQAVGMAPPNSLESVILANLYPGNYSAILRGSNFSQGVAIVEIYKLH